MPKRWRKNLIESRKSWRNLKGKNNEFLSEASSEKTLNKKRKGR